MNAQESMLQQTLVKVREHIAPSPELLSDIRAAIVRAERRRRRLAVATCLAVLAATILALTILVTIRASH